MNIIWISIVTVIIILTAFLPDDVAIALDIIDLWIRAAWVWLRGLQLRIGLWLRLKWDGSWFAWRLWVIRQRTKHNINNKTKVNE